MVEDDEDEEEGEEGGEGEENESILETSTELDRTSTRRQTMAHYNELKGLLGDTEEPLAESGKLLGSVGVDSGAIDEKPTVTEPTVTEPTATELKRTDSRRKTMAHYNELTSMLGDEETPLLAEKPLVLDSGKLSSAERDSLLNEELSTLTDSSA